MTSIPLYFGDPKRARFGLLSWPDGAARAGAVICPPLDYENVCARESLRVLAERLTAGGTACLRVQYDGTENSMGCDTDPGRVSSWLASISDAIETMTGFGFAGVTLIGLRVGALLASQLVTRDDVIGFVEWDAVESGRRFSRTLRLLADTTDLTDRPSDGDDSTGIVYVGNRYTAAALADLAKVKHGLVPSRIRWLVVERDPSESPPAGPPTQDCSSDHAVRVRLRGTRDMLERTAETAVVPRDIVRHIAKWVCHEAETPVALVPAPSCVEQNALQCDGNRTLMHTTERLQPAGLLAITTRVAASRPKRAVVMINNGKASLIGPGGAWVDFARELVASDLLVMRVDLSGLADSPVRPGRVDGDDYPSTAAADLDDVCEHLVTYEVEQVTLVGLCSGALLGYDGALANALITDIVSINARFDKPFRDRRADRSSRASGQTSWPLSVVLSKSPLYPYIDRTPAWIWRVAARLRLVAAPSVALRQVLHFRPSTHILLLFSRGERGRAALMTRSAREFTAILDDARVEMIDLDSTDHSMFDLRMRRRVLDIVRHRLTLNDGPLTS